MTGKKDTVRALTVNSCLVVDHAHFANGSQLLSSLNNVSCVDQSSSVKNVTNAPTVVPDLPVGARLHQFWKKNG